LVTSHDIQPGNKASLFSKKKIKKNKKNNKGKYMQQKRKQVNLQEEKGSSNKVHKHKQPI